MLIKKKNASDELEHEVLDQIPSHLHNRPATLIAWKSFASLKPWSATDFVHSTIIESRPGSDWTPFWANCIGYADNNIFSGKRNDF